LSCENYRVSKQTNEEEDSQTDTARDEDWGEAECEVHNVGK
jgi:hypothetical protein